jgi:large repetitive protein
VKISFSELLRANSVKADSIRVTLNGAPVAGSVQLLPNGTDVVFLQTALLQDFTTYAVSVSGVRDRAGNPLAAQHVFRRRS